MMREVLSRRFSNNWEKPDLILLDGGQGHLNAIIGLFKVLNLNAPLVAVAKGRNRKNLNFQFPEAGQTISSEFLMPKSSNNMRKILDDKILIKNIMDEAHRFAIGFHRKLRKKEFIS